MKSKMPRRRNGARINPEWLVAGMLLVTTAFMAFALSPVPSNKPAYYPAWWFERDVVQRVDSGLTNPVWPTNYLPADDFAVLNAGQLKTLATRAYDELQEWMPASVWSGASNAPGPLLSHLILGWGSNTSAGDNYAVVNQGQLKQVAKHFYDVLAETGYPAGTNATPSGWTNGIYPWSFSENDPDSYAAANVGQAKYLFSFDLETSDSDEDGLPDGWEMAHFGSLGADDEGDADGDGLTNLAEFQQGSDPTDYYSQGSLTITPHLAKLSGDNQSGQPGQYFPDPLVVEVRSGSSTGAVLANAPVSFAATAGGGGLSSEFDGSPVSPTLSITTGTDGRAQAFHRQGFAGGLSTVTATTGTASVSFDASSPLADGLWSRWPFSEGAGSVTADTTNLTVSGTLAGGATWTERFTGQNALSFSGTGQFVSMGDAAALDLGEESFSVAFWVKYADAPSSGNTMRIVSKGNTNWGTGYFVGIRENGKLASGIGTASGTQANALLFRTTGTFNNNEWRHVAVVYNRTAATARIYVDGEAQELEKEAGTGGTASGPTLSYTGLEGLSASGTGSSFSVASSNGTNDFFGGAVDDVRIYRKALSGAAVDNLRNADDDANGLPDWWEARHLGAAGTDPEADADEDGLSNIEEYYQGTNPADDDTDGDGMADGWEISCGFDPLDNADTAGDADGDGLTNLQEFQQESDPTDYYSQGSTTVAPVLSIVSGNEQTGNTNAYLAEALTVEVRSGSSTGALLSNAPVTYSVAEGGGRLATAFGGTTTHPTLALRTGTNGQTAAWYKQGPQDRVESTISVTSGTAAPVEFTAWTLDLVGHWKLDEGSGATTADSGPFECSGTLVNGPQWSERYPGENALTFSGSNEHVLVASGTGGELDFEDASFTVTAWVKTGTAPAAGRILSKGNENSDPGYYLALTADGQIETGLGTVHSGTAAETIRIKTTGSFNDDTWHAVAAVYDRANATARIYVDGTARQIVKEPGTGGTVTVSGSTSLNYPDLENLSGSRPDKDFTLASQSGASAFFAGSLDETRLYRKALSAEEILDLHRQEGELTAVAGELTIPEDTLGTLTLQSHGGGDAAATYEVVTPSTNGTTELSGASVNYYPNAHFSGTDSFRFRVTKGTNTAEADVAITVTPINDPPLVSVGGGLSTTMSGSTATVNLTATVTDIDTDPEDITLTWMKAFGTGTVTFSGTNPLAATATFDAPGEYTLRLSAFDGASTRSDSLAVVVNPSGTNALPTITFEEPANNIAYAFAEPIVLKAEASADTGLSVAKVEFYEGSRKIAEVTSPDGTSGLFELSWTPPRLGAYRLSARVTDSAGGVSFSSSIQTRVTDAGWFSEMGTVAGNEGYAGSGGNGGITSGSSTGTGSNYAPGTGGNGGGSSSGGGGDGIGNPAGTDPTTLDSDGDGLTDAEEKEIGTNPMPGGEDTDGDGVSDGEDGWAGGTDLEVEALRAPIRLPKVNYAIITIAENATAIHVNEKGEMLIQTSGTFSLWSDAKMTPLPNNVSSVIGLTNEGAVLGTLGPDGELEWSWSHDSQNFQEKNVLGFKWTKGAGLQVFQDLHADPSAIPTEADGNNFFIANYQTVFAASGNGIAVGFNFEYFLQREWWNDGRGEPDPILQDGMLAQGVKWSTNIGVPVENVEETYFIPEFVNNLGTMIGRFWENEYWFWSMANDSWFYSDWSSFDIPYSDIYAIRHNGANIVLEEGFYPKSINDDDVVLGFNNKSCFLFPEDEFEVHEITSIIGWCLNSRMQVIGGDQLWQNYRSYSLDDLVSSDWDVFGTSDISDNGLIAAKVKRKSDGKEYAAMLIPVDMAVDGNRDGFIRFAGNYNDSSVAGKPTDKTEEVKPFRFWINDDDDRENKDHPGSSKKDSTNNRIESLRDLEDFTRLHLYIGGLQDAVAEGTFSVGLEWRNTNGTNPSIKVYQAAEADGGDDYLRTSLGGFNQSMGTVAAALGTVSSGGSFKLPASFWEAGTVPGTPALSAENPNRYLIFEGVSEGKGQLVMTFWKGTEKIGEGGSVWIDLMNIKKMYVRAKGTPETNIDAPWDDDPSLDTGFVSDPFVKPQDEEKKVLIYVHGIHAPFAGQNASYLGNVNVAETAYKRLWHAGYKGRFAIYKWPALNPAGFFTSGTGFEFNQSEYRAWKYGKGLSAFAASMPGDYQRNVLAHSQGNAVVAAAFRDYNLAAATWVVTQGAIPISCYDDNTAHLVFSYTTPDLASNLGYRGYLKDQVPAKVVNFFNLDDSVTGQVWEANQSLFKPTIELVGITRIEYKYYAGSGEVRLQKFFISALLSDRAVSDLHESMAMVVKSRSRSIGHGSTAGGEVNTLVDLNAEFSFGDEHGSQWDRAIQENVTLYFERLLDEIE